MMSRDLSTHLSRPTIFLPSLSKDWFVTTGLLDCTARWRLKQSIAVVVFKGLDYAIQWRLLSVYIIVWSSARSLVSRVS